MKLEYRNPAKLSASWIVIHAEKYLRKPDPMNDRDSLPVPDTRLILFGSEGGFSRPVLEQLLTRGLNVIAVVMVEPLSNKDFPVNIKQTANRDSLEASAIKNRVEILKTPNLHNDAFLKQLKEKQGDILLIACFSQKIPARIWQKMKLPCWNLHPSLLPGYRGPNPLYWQISHGETKTGLTLHEVTRVIDSGNILARKKLALPANQDKNSLDSWVAVNGVDLFCNVLVQYLHGDLKPKPQDASLASYFPAPTPVEKP